LEQDLRGAEHVRRRRLLSITYVSEGKVNYKKVLLHVRGKDLESGDDDHELCTWKRCVFAAGGKSYHRMEIT
jgi:hypothetical protein